MMMSDIKYWVYINQKPGLVRSFRGTYAFKCNSEGDAKEVMEILKRSNHDVQHGFSSNGLSLTTLDQPYEY